MVGVPCERRAAGSGRSPLEAVGWNEGLGGTLARGKHTANASTWVRHVANVPWDQMDVHMHARLTSSCTDVDSNVVAVWREREL
jgi:hypothetical protein